jgi:hypothetical protein
MGVPIDAVITAVMSALGALIAAWVGTRLGLRRFRQERAFDARLEWHRKLAETTKILENRTRALGAFKRGGTPIEVALPLVKDLSELAFKFQELTELGSLYATKRTHAAIQDALAQMTKSAQTFREYPGDESVVTQAQAQEMYASGMSGMQRVYDLLARDLREMLGLELLDEHLSLEGKDRWTEDLEG